MKLNEFIKELRAKYNSVSIKKLASKKHCELYHFSYKNKREQNELLVINKNKEIITKEKVKKDVNFKQFATLFKKNVSEYIKQKRNIQKAKQNEAKKIGVRNLKTIDIKAKQYEKRLEELEKKKIADTKFKNDKQKKDAIYLFIIASIILEFLKDDKKLVELKNDIVVKKENVELALGEKELLNIYLYIVKQLNSIGILKGRIKYDIVKINADKVLDKVFNKYNNEIFHYQILMGMYMIDFYKNDIKFKELDLVYNKQYFADLLEATENAVSKEHEEYRENSQKLAYDISEEIYNKRVMTKQQAKEFFKKNIGENNDAN